MRILLCSILVFSAAVTNAQRSDFSDISFARADSIALSYYSHGLKDVRGLTQKLTNNLHSDVEKARAIYRWICDNIANDYGLAARVTRDRSKKRTEKELLAYNREFTDRVVSTLRNTQQTVCTGYAYLMKQMSYHAGLKCEIVNGYGRTIQSNIGGDGTLNHSWNAVQLGGKWYLCDATWSSGSMDLSTKGFQKKFFDRYFLADPRLFIRNHYPIDSSWMFLDEKPTLGEFLNRPINYTGIYDFNVTDLLPDKFKIDAVVNTPVIFKLKLDVRAPKVELWITRGAANARTLNVEGVIESDGYLNIAHTFTTKGLYSVTVMVTGKNVAGWEVNVR